jgi:hypothetical protein
MTLRLVSTATIRADGRGGGDHGSDAPPHRTDVRAVSGWSELPATCHELTQLADKLRRGGLAECSQVEVEGDRLWVLFPESDFAVRIDPTGADATTRVSISAAVRAPAPSLETWWCEWTLACTGRDLCADLGAEITRRRRRYVQMLQERFMGECG